MIIRTEMAIMSNILLVAAITLILQWTPEVSSQIMVAVHSNQDTNVKNVVVRRDVDEQNEAETQPLDISSLHVTSSITARYSKSVVSSRMTNDQLESREGVFQMLLPETAFISNFSMEIGDVMYYGVVKDKVQAQKEYDEAVDQGRTAGQVSAEQSSRGFTPFTISVNVAAQSSVTFTLVYEELLRRRLGIYEHRTSIRPGQVVPDLKIDVFLIEPSGITALVVPEIQKDDAARATIDDDMFAMVTVTTSDDDKSAHIYYYPSMAQQLEESEDGIVGNFLVLYDVAHHYNAGEILLDGDYFVHFFAPPSSGSQLSVFPKNVIFIIDVSGSMSGTKLDQTKDAMKSILLELEEFDRFNILTFSDEVMEWRTSELVSATTSNINAARAYVESLNTIGGTNINDGLLEGITLMRRNTNSEMKSVEILIMLTDGEPTTGVVITKDIRSNVQRANAGQFAIFCLGFGANVDFAFLEALSYENNGLARKIYEDADASLQLTGFFQEVAMPILVDIEVRYIENTVALDTVTENTFVNYFSGSEIVVAGKLDEGNSVGEVKTIVTAVSVEEDIELIGNRNRNDMPDIVTSSNAVGGFTKRLWVYLTINGLLRESKSMEENSVIKNATIAKALEMALQYNLVTELTSMIIIGPDINSTDLDGSLPGLMENDLAMAGAGGGKVFSMNAGASILMSITSLSLLVALASVMSNLV